MGGLPHLPPVCLHTGLILQCAAERHGSEHFPTPAEPQVSLAVAVANGEGQGHAARPSTLGNAPSWGICHPARKPRASCVSLHCPT